jgi:hypothetical protein
MNSGGEGLPLSRGSPRFGVLTESSPRTNPWGTAWSNATPTHLPISAPCGPVGRSQPNWTMAMHRGLYKASKTPQYGPLSASRLGNIGPAAEIGPDQP